MKSFKKYILEYYQEGEPPDPVVDDEMGRGGDSDNMLNLDRHRKPFLAQIAADEMARDRDADAEDINPWDFPPGTPRMNDIPNYYNPETGEEIYINWGPPTVIVHKMPQPGGRPPHWLVITAQGNQNPQPTLYQMYNASVWINGIESPYPAGRLPDFLPGWDKPSLVPGGGGWVPGPFDPWDSQGEAPHYPSDYGNYPSDPSGGWPDVGDEYRA